MVQCFALEEGTYQLSYRYACEQIADNPTFRLRGYVRSGTAWLYDGTISVTLTQRIIFEDHKREVHRFSVTGDMLTMVFITGTSNTDGHRGIDVWDVVLRRIE